jgi:4-amino-4-deoxy-L-arabinose transferase-like glycosyltransferase
VRRVRRIPVPLALLLVVALIEALAWMVAIPALQGPDEVGHVAYVQRIVDAHQIPFRKDRASFPEGATEDSSEVALTGTWAGLGPLRGNPAARPFWTKLDEQLYQRRRAQLPPGARTDGGYSSSFRNPPLYYLYEAVPYRLWSSSDVLTRTFVMRLADIPLLLVAVAAAWLLAAELLGPGLIAPTLTAAVVALQPQMTNVAAGVSPDTALVAAWTIGLLLMVRLVRRGASVRRVLGLAAVVAVAALLQPRGLPMLVPAALAILLGVRQGRIRGRVIAAIVGAAAIVAAAVSVFVVSRGVGSIRQFASYLWQFYLPKLPFMDVRIGPPYDVRDVFVDRLWGAFAQLEVSPAGTLLDVIAWGTLSLAVITVVGLVAQRRAVARRWRELAVLAAAPLASMAVLHLTAYRTLLRDHTDPVIAGRYLLPFLSLAGLALAVVLRRFPPRVTAAGAAVAVGTFALLQLVSLGLVFERFYG